LCLLSLIFFADDLFPHRLRPLKAWFGANLHKICPKVITPREFAQEPLELGICGKPDDHNSVWTSTVNHLCHVTSKGLIMVKMSRVKWGIKKGNRIKSFSGVILLHLRGHHELDV